MVVHNLLYRLLLGVSDDLTQNGAELFMGRRVGADVLFGCLLLFCLVHGHQLLVTRRMEWFNPFRSAVPLGAQTLGIKVVFRFLYSALLILIVPRLP